MKTVSNHAARLLESLPYPIVLYCARTILHGYARPSRILNRAAFSTAPTTSRGDETASRDGNGQKERASFFEEKAKQSRGKDAQSPRTRHFASSNPLDTTSTITEKERNVFRKIFKDIAIDFETKELQAASPPGQKSKATSALEQKLTSPVDYRQIFSIFSDAPLEETLGNDEDAALTASDERQVFTAGESSNANSTLSDQDTEHIQKYPDRLRKIASRATLLAKTESPHSIAHGGRVSQRASQSNQPLENYATPRANFSVEESEFSEAAVQERAIDSICATQMNRISKILIQAAKVTDKKLWTACETSVFPLLAHLETPPSRSSTRATSKNLPSANTTVPWQTPGQPYPSPTIKATSAESDMAHSKRQKESVARESTSSSPGPRPPFRLPPTIPPLPVISTLYPALLLLILRLLTTHYPLSHYTSSLLPRVRALGLRSYVLGTSTQLYDTLLAHRWDVYSDLRSMDTLLQEMERGGIDFNTETVQVLERVRRAKMEDELAEKSASEEREREKELLPQLSKKQRKEREKARQRAISAGKYDGTSAGQRARLWWTAELTVKWFDRVVGAGGWRSRVMERLREKRHGKEKRDDDEEGEEEEVVEREYADSNNTGGGGGGGAGEGLENGSGSNSKQSVPVWL